MSTKKDKPVAGTADREILITRTFKAPREMVWNAMTDPLQVVRWWGPNGFTTTIEKMDVRPGGVWKHVMHGPDGTDYPNKSIFKEVVKPERIVYSHGGGRKGARVAHFLATWTFEAQGKGTKVTLHFIFPTAAARDHVVKEYGAIEGGKQTLARLDEHLAALSAGATQEPSDRDFVISRVFSAPRELVWQAWTEPKHMAKWWGPHQFTNPVCKMDVRPGGAWRIVMRGPDGMEYPLKGVFREIAAPERLVLLMDCSEHPVEWHDMVNPNRDKTKKPALDCIQTVTFEKAGDKTKLTITTRLETAAIRDAMVKMGMNDGWSQSLERLEKLLKKM